MSSFGNLLKRLRNEAGLSQAQLAERMDVSTNTIQNWEKGIYKVDHDNYPKLADILNIPIDVLVKEYCREQGEKRMNNWPSFLFDKEINDVIDTLHLNMNQQELFGLLYIYNAEYLQKDSIDYNTIYDDINRIPYQFIGKIGSIQFMNIVDGLQKVIKHVQSDFLLKVLKANPEYEFDIRRLPKNLICDFIDYGHKEINIFEEGNIEGSDDYEGDDAISFNIRMNKAKIFLPILSKGPIHITDGFWLRDVRKYVPKELVETLEYEYERWISANEERKNYECSYWDTVISSGIEIVTNHYNTAPPGEPKDWYLEINDMGRLLLEWFEEGDKNEK